MNKEEVEMIEAKYEIGNVVPYINTASKIVWAEITSFKTIERNKRIWFYGIDTKTKAEVFYPVHLSQNYLSAMKEYAIAGRTKSMERERELEEGLRLFLKVINRSNTALEYYGDAINNAEQLLNQTP